MIYDCFLFNNELELLDIRLNELSNVVDKFVITESTVTHMNKKKRLHYYENRIAFKKFKNQIIHNVIDDSPNVNLPWIINDFQFTNMARGLINCKSDDIILFGDLDEIPSAKKVREWSIKKGEIKVFKQWLFYYFLNYGSAKPYEWKGTRMMKYKNLKKIKTLWIGKYSKVNLEIPEGGWHFSYIGGVKRIQEKISSQAHQEFNNDRFNTPENIIMGIRSGKDFMNMGIKFKIVNDNLLPEYAISNKVKFASLFLTKEFNSRQVFFDKLVLPKKSMARIFLRRIRRKLS